MVDARLDVDGGNELGLELVACTELELTENPKVVCAVGTVAGVVEVPGDAEGVVGVLVPLLITCTVVDAVPVDDVDADEAMAVEADGTTVEDVATLLRGLVLALAAAVGELGALVRSVGDVLDELTGADGDGELSGVIIGLVKGDIGNDEAVDMAGEVDPRVVGGELSPVEPAEDRTLDEGEIGVVAGVETVLAADADVIDVIAALVIDVSGGVDIDGLEDAAVEATLLPLLAALIDEDGRPDVELAPVGPVVGVSIVDVDGDTEDADDAEDAIVLWLVPPVVTVGAFDVAAVDAKSIVVLRLLAIAGDVSVARVVMLVIGGNDVEERGTVLPIVVGPVVIGTLLMVLASEVGAPLDIWVTELLPAGRELPVDAVSGALVTAVVGAVVGPMLLADALVGAVVDPPVVMGAVVIGVVDVSDSIVVDVNAGADVGPVVARGVVIGVVGAVDSAVIAGVVGPVDKGAGVDPVLMGGVVAGVVGGMVGPVVGGIVDPEVGSEAKEDTNVVMGRLVIAGVVVDPATML